LDGTLADTSGDLIDAANAALIQMGYSAQLTHGDDSAVAVRGGRRMLAVAHDRLGITGVDAEQGIEAGYPLLLEAYDASIAQHTTLYPGALEAIDGLTRADIRVSICTNKPESLAEKLLREMGIRELFGALVGADTLPVRKPDPAPLKAAAERTGGTLERAVLVGDSDTDRKTARAAGVPCILVGFGPATRTEMVALEPEAIIDHFDDLLATVNRLLPD